jgi:hypothetical protein
MEIATVGSGYIDGFSGACSKYLPDNAVEIMTTVCDSYWVTYNRYGETSRTCNSSHQKGTGVFADPALYTALNSAPVQTLGSGMRTVFDAVLSGGNPITGALDMGQKLFQIKADSETLVTQNGCTSPALRRFQENLQRFALGQDGMQLNGTVKLGVAMLPPPAGEEYRDSNYSKLLDDMVTEQSKTWAINRYAPGSLQRVRVNQRDSSGRPARISGQYTYSGFSGRQQGNVTLELEQGRPRCLYFSDQPSVCRTPANRLTFAYINGSYR